MIDKLNSIIKKYNDLSDSLSDPSIISQPKQFAKIAKEHKSLTIIVQKSQCYLDKQKQLHDNEELLTCDDDEMIELVKEEIPTLKKELEDLEEELKILLIPKDPNDNNNTIIEIRGGTGGDEAALFVEDLLRMYTRYAERNKWSYDIIWECELKLQLELETINSIIQCHKKNWVF